MNALSARRLSSCSFEPWAALVALRALVSVAPITRTPGMSARSRAATSRMPAVTVSSAALPFLEKSLMPSSQITAETPDSDSTSRSSRAPAEGPPANGFAAEYSAGPAT